MTKLSSNIYHLPPHTAALKALTASEREILRYIARKTRGKALTRLTGSYIANALHHSRQYVNRILSRFETLGLIVRLKTGFLQLRLEKLHDIKDRVAKIARRKMTKCVKSLLNSRRGNHRFPKLKKIEITPQFNAPAYSSKALFDDYHRAKGSQSGNISVADLLRMKKNK